MNTDNTTPQHYQQKLQGLRNTYLQRLKKSLRDVRRLQELLLKDMAPLKDLQGISQLAHNLTGSGATFGFPGISQSATDLQLSLKALINASATSGDPHHERHDVLDKVAVFYEASRVAIQHNSITTSAVTPGLTVASTAGADHQVIGLLSRKENVVTDEMNYLTRHGYKVVSVDSLQMLKSVPDMTAAIIYDDVSVSDEAELNDLAVHGKAVGLNVPFIYRVADDDFKSHLRAVRLGASSSLAHTASGQDLEHALQTITAQHPQQPHVYMAVKDDMLTVFYEHMLIQAGCRVTPLKANKDPLRALTADEKAVIIVDFETPFANGADFIAVVKRLTREQPLSVIFTATKDEYQTLAVPPHDVCFLLKPFTPEQLIKAVETIHAQR